MRGRRVILAGALAAAVLVVAWPAAAQREQGWAVRESLTNPDVPLYNTAKQKLVDGGQVFTYTIASRDPEFYCEVAPHYDFIFFEMSTAPTSRCSCVQAVGDDRAVRWLDGTATQRPLERRREMEDGDEAAKRGIRKIGGPGRHVRNLLSVTCRRSATA